MATDVIGNNSKETDLPATMAYVLQQSTIPGPAATTLADETALSDHEFARARALIHRLAGIRLPDSKRSMVLGRLARCLRAGRFASIDELLRGAERGGAHEREAFVNALTTNLTSFFREPHHFPVLAEVARGAGAQRGEVRIWCAGCSTGEEAWTAAMVALDALAGTAGRVRVEASDIDTGVLRLARAGCYAAQAAAAIPERLRRRHFDVGADGSIRVRPELAAAVRFRHANLHESGAGPAGPLDAIFCRNVMIYFDRPAQERLVRVLAGRLAPGGRLFVGHSETLSFAADALVPCGRTTYRLAGAP